MIASLPQSYLEIYLESFLKIKVLLFGSYFLNYNWKSAEIATRLQENVKNIVTNSVDSLLL